ADAVKGGKKYKFTSTQHFINYEDITAVEVKAGKAAAVSCSDVIDNQSCPNGVCVTSAIANYTNRADINKFDSNTRAEAILFLTHYIGDITQPMHNCAKLRGGNDYFIKWKGSAMQPPPYQKNKHALHFIWDQYLSDTDMEENYGSSTTAYVDAIVKDITCGAWKDVAASWVSCKAPLKTDSGMLVNSVCPIDWSQDGNGFNCKTAWEDLAVNENAQTDDLYSNGYYAKNKEIARMQIAKGGLRLAFALNAL
ncbi:S1/P1 nuclease, partial [Chytriomyces cf. hyalinus JEL632]